MDNYRENLATIKRCEKILRSWGYCAPRDENAKEYEEAMNERNVAFIELMREGYEFFEYDGFIRILNNQAMYDYSKTELIDFVGEDFYVELLSQGNRVDCCAEKKDAAVVEQAPVTQATAEQIPVEVDEKLAERLDGIESVLKDISVKVLDNHNILTTDMQNMKAKAKSAEEKRKEFEKLVEEYQTKEANAEKNSDPEKDKKIERLEQLRAHAEKLYREEEQKRVNSEDRIRKLEAQNVEQTALIEKLKKESERNKIIPIKHTVETDVALDAAKKQGEMLKEEIAKAREGYVRNVDSQLIAFEEYEKVRKLAYFDKLTGLKNLNSFNDEFKECEKEDVILSLFSVCFTKQANEFYGRSAGDNMIKAAAEALKSAFDEKTVYRVIGDQFAIISKDSSFGKVRGHLNNAIGELKAQNIFGAYGIVSKDKATSLKDMLVKAEGYMNTNRMRIHSKEDPFAMEDGTYEEEPEAEVDEVDEVEEEAADVVVESADEALHRSVLELKKNFEALKSTTESEDMERAESDEELDEYLDSVTEEEASEPSEMVKRLFGEEESEEDVEDPSLNYEELALYFDSVEQTA